MLLKQMKTMTTDKLIAMQWPGLTKYDGVGLFFLARYNDVSADIFSSIVKVGI